MIGSLLSASRNNLPTGPMIVLVLTAFLIFSFLFGAKRGIVLRKIALIKRERSFDHNRIMLALDNLAQSHDDTSLAHSSKTIGLMVQQTHGMHRMLKQLAQKGLLIQSEEASYALSKQGELYVKNLKNEGGLYAG